MDDWCAAAYRGRVFASLSRFSYASGCLLLLWLLWHHHPFGAGLGSQTPGPVLDEQMAILKETPSFAIFRAMTLRMLEP